MKIGITSGGYTDRYGLYEGALKMRAHGYDCLDYQSFVCTDTEYFRVSEAEFERILKDERIQIETGGVCVWQTHAPWRWPSHDATEEERAERFDVMSRSIRGTSYLGAKYFAVHNIMPFGAVDTDLQFVRDVNTDFFGRLAEVAKQYGVIICLENMPFPDQSLARPIQLIEFVKSLKNDNIKICLDTGHCAVFKMSPGDAVRMIGKDYLKILHVHDNDGISDLHRMPYTGWIDWDDFAKALQDIDYDGCVSLETSVGNTPYGEERTAKEIDLADKAKKIAGL